MTGAGWIVPKKYVEKIGDEGYKKAPVGAGPYKFVSFNPGVELVFEAFEQYWRKPPSVKRLVFKVIPDEATRLAALKRGEVDIVYSIRGELAEDLQRTPGLTLKPAVVQGVFCVYFPDQWDSKSPWHDERVRRAASLAIDRKGTNEALTLGYSLVTGNPIVPDHYEFFWQPPPPVYDPEKAKQLLAEAGYKNGFDAGDYHCDSSYANIGEAIVDNFAAIGIRARLRPLERAAFVKEYSEKKLKNIIQAGPGAFGNAATRVEANLVKGGVFSYGSYPDIDELYRQQAVELDRPKREAILAKSFLRPHGRRRRKSVGSDAAGRARARRARSRRRRSRSCLRRAPRPADLGRAHLAGADLVRPGGDLGDHYPLHDPVRVARCTGEADARSAVGSEPGRVVDCCRGRAQL